MTDFELIEKKWQKKWEDAKVFKTVDDSKKKKFYCLEMFPYPSASFCTWGMLGVILLETFLRGIKE